MDFNNGNQFGVDNSSFNNGNQFGVDNSMLNNQSMPSMMNQQNNFKPKSKKPKVIIGVAAVGLVAVASGFLIFKGRSDETKGKDTSTNTVEKDKISSNNGKIISVRVKDKNDYTRYNIMFDNGEMLFDEPVEGAYAAGELYYIKIDKGIRYIRKMVRN